MVLKDERYSEISPKDERYSSDRQMERYYEERGSHYYREVRDEREIGLSGSNNGSTSMGRHSQEPETDRGKIF